MSVFPRTPFELERSDLPFQAWLGRPLVLYGHHGDMRDGAEPLRAAAETARSLGARFARPEDIAWRAWRLACDGPRAVAQMWGSCARIGLASSVEELAVLPHPEDSGARFDVRDEEGAVGTLTAGDTLVVRPSSHVTLTRVAEAPFDPFYVDAGPANAWPVIRRLLVQARDRSAPYVPRRGV
jgi:hypothetical protein